MVNRLHLIAATLLAAIELSTAQCAGPLNTNADCYIAGPDTSGETVYYAPGDNEDFGIKMKTTGTCDAGSYVASYLIQPGGAQSFCGCIAANGNYQTVDCSQLVRGTAPEGSYTFKQHDLSGDSTLDFTVTHTQITSTVATPTSTVSVYPTVTQTYTATTTPTDTVTSSQVTVTTPGTTNTNTITVTPKMSTTTTTKTFTFVKVTKKYTSTLVTTTKTAPCTQATTYTCPKSAVTKRDAAPSLARKGRFFKRGTPNTDDVRGTDGPLTTTVTPAPSVYTETEPASTTTETVTATAPDTTTTVPAAPPTFTVYSGTAVKTVTITIPAKTRTKTAYTYTVTSTTTTQTFTLTSTVSKGPYPCT